MIKVVFLVLTTYNTWTGELLFRSEMRFDRLAKDPIAECLDYGTLEARHLSERFPDQHASTNVDCEWRLTEGAPA